MLIIVPIKERCDYTHNIKKLLLLTLMFSAYKTADGGYSKDTTPIAG